MATGGYGSPAEYRFGILTAVDLVPVGGDPGARITSTIDTADLSPELRRCRAAFDAYLANLANPQQLDLLDRVHRLGLRAFDPLASVVAGIRDHYQAQSAKRQVDIAAVRGMVRGHRASTSLLAPAMAAHSRSKVDRAITPSPTTHLRPSQ